jgi:phage terminase large subunit
LQSPVRILCAREFQVSISDSVHHLLAAQIEAMGLQSFFAVGESFIRGNNGSEFIFRGLRRNPTGIKSMEDVTICWVEEAQDISESSWEMLTPTIRAPGSEIWVTFNPNEVSDPTYRRFVADPMPGVVSRRVNCNDNPHFPPELELERAWMAKTDPDAYAHIWNGECRQASDAQVLRGKLSIEAFVPGADWQGPYFGADWGFAQDPTTLVKLWIHNQRLYVEHEAYGVGVEIDHTPAMFDKVPGSRQHIIRADSARPETISYMHRQQFNVIAAPKWPGSVEDGVMFLRGFEQIVIHQRCKHAID